MACYGVDVVVGLVALDSAQTRLVGDSLCVLKGGRIREGLGCREGSVRLRRGVGGIDVLFACHGRMGGSRADDGGKILS